MKLVALFVNKARQVALASELAAHGVEVAAMPSIGAMLQALRRGEAQAALLEDADTRLIDWLAMLQLRMGGVVPVIVMGGAGGSGMADALAHGATDYVEHTDRAEQLLIRLRARVGRSASPAGQGMEVGPYALNSATSVVFRDGVEINLTAREFALAWVLFSNAGRVVSASCLAARVWGHPTDVCKRTLEQHVYRLRRKLSCDGTDAAVRISAVYSVGYRLDLMTRGHAAWRATDFGLESDSTQRMRPPTAPYGRRSTDMWGEQ